MNNKPVFEQLELKCDSVSPPDENINKKLPKPEEVFHTGGYPLWRQRQISKNRKAREYDKLLDLMLKDKINTEQED